jgi:hypothetical protein
MSTAPSRQCRALRQWLPEYAEDKLAGPRGAAIAEHLAGCSRCREEVAALRAMLSSLHAVGQEAAPAHVLASIRASLQDPAAPRHLPKVRRAPALWTRLAVPIAAATGLVAIAFALRHPAAPPLAAMSPPAAQTAPAAPVPRIATPVTPPSPEGEQVRPPRAVRGGRGGGAAARRREVMGRGPAPAPTQVEPSPGAAELQVSRPMETVRGIGGPPSPAPRPAAADSVTAAAGEPAAPAVTPRPAQKAAGGGGLAGGVARGAAPPSAPRAWRAVPPGPYARRYGRGTYPERRRFGRVPGAAARAGSAPAAPRRESEGRPPASAAVVQTERGQAIALRLEPSMGRKVKVYAGNQVIQPTGESVERVLLPAGGMGASPSQVPITVSSEAGDWKYTLFTPGAGQLGKQQSTAVRRYQLEPLSQVLADLSAQSGLVLLVEGSTERKVEGELPLASPKEAVAQLAEAANLDAYTEDGVVYTLRPRR